VTSANKALHQTAAAILVPDSSLSDSAAAAGEFHRSAAEGDSMNLATWNVLHDGRVIAAEGSVPGDLRLSIEIAYLCHHLPTKAEHLIVTLVGCDRFEYQPYEQAPLAEPSAIAALGLELLTAGAGLDSGCINIECADGGYGGRLLLRYASAHLHTAEGDPLSQSELESASERYWSLRQQRHLEHIYGLPSQGRAPESR
jgi:hypothetical protein